MSQKGFSIVEVVVAIVLVGIVASLAMSRFLGSNTFNPVAIQGQIVSLVRAAQQSAMGRQDVTVTLTPNGDTLNLTLEEVNGDVESIDLNMQGISLSGDVNETDSCGTTAGATAITNGNPLILNFGSLGDLEDSGFGAGTTVESAVRICVNNDPTYSVCVSPAGFAYEGDCDA